VTKTASLTWLYDGWTTDCPSNAVTQTVTVNPGPTSAFAWSSTGLSVTFTNMSTDATSYAWVFGDAGTASAPNPVHNYATSGTYTVELTATGACGSNLSFTNITITDSTNEGNIGVVEFNDDLVVNMYPNPASTQLNVDLNLKEAADVNTQIINSKGQLIYTQQNGNSNAFHLNYNTSALENGVYFLRIQYGDAVFSRPFLKQ
ncbi:MAG TPA: T9SS type A sorting domain-containing protein, partial [Flavobacteriales bacterium]|nr:T9SS type A sorting domain-containing protein [Flavobacteriales bacterium]